MNRYATFFGCAVLFCLLAASARGQEPVVYPAKGQTQDQTEKDKYQCYGWAKQQTGFDPMQGPAQPQASTSRSTPVRGAAGGAALGAVGGAIAGDAGKGAAIGAGTGALVGGVRMRREREQETQARQTQAAASCSSGIARPRK